MAFAFKLLSCKSEPQHDDEAKGPMLSVPIDVDELSDWETFEDDVAHCCCPSRIMVNGRKFRRLSPSVDEEEESTDFDDNEMELPKEEVSDWADWDDETPECSASVGSPGSPQLGPPDAPEVAAGSDSDDDAGAIVAQPAEPHPIVALPAVPHPQPRGGLRSLLASWTIVQGMEQTT